MNLGEGKLVLLALTSVVQFCVISAIVQKDEFDLAVARNGYPVPSEQVYQYFAESTGNFSRGEAAMLVAQLIHESGGFKFTEQTACLGGKCKERYVDSVGLAQKSYHGRGYIQLTWAANYKLASEALGMAARLLEHPEIVAEDRRIAMLVSVWYWIARVEPLLRSQADHFGLTTKAINPLECLRPNALARRRYRIYLRVLEAWNVTRQAKENGCYN